MLQIIMIVVGIYLAFKVLKGIFKLFALIVVGFAALWLFRELDARGVFAMIDVARMYIV